MPDVKLNTPKRPSGQQKPQVRRSSRTRNNSNTIGMVIIGVSLIALGCAAYAFYKKNIVPPLSSAQPEQEAQLQKDPVVPEGSKHPEDVTGSWIIRQGDAKALVTFSKDIYQIVFISDAKGEVRNFSRGNTSYDLGSGRLSLTPNATLGEPKSTEKIAYKMLTASAYDVILSQNEKKPGLLYWEPGPEMASIGRVHPLFSILGVRGASLLMWERVEAAPPTATAKK